MCFLEKGQNTESFGNKISHKICPMKIFKFSERFPSIDEKVSNPIKLLTKSKNYQEAFIKLTNDNDDATNNEIISAIEK